MASNPNPNKEAEPFWPVTFEDVREAQLKAALAATPVQRLAWAEELLEFARLAEAARVQSAEKAR
jgi:hypothetical protein